MSFHKDIASEPIPFETIHTEGMCFGCGEVLGQIAIRYDGYSEPGLVKSIFMHPECASAMAKIIICDTWPNRRHK